MVNIFEYNDYRVLLKDIYEDFKSRDSKYSYRYIANKAGFKSAGFFNHILTGKSNVSLPMAIKIAEVFHLKKIELEYFEQLLLFNQSKTQAEKQRYFYKILSLKKTNHKQIEPSQYEMFRKWYYVAIREVLSYYNFKDDYGELIKKITPKITIPQAKRAIKVLEKLKLIAQDSEGYYRHVDATLTTGDIWQSMTITDFQMNTLDLAKKSYDLFEGKHRDHSTLSVSISEQDYKRIKGKLAKTRKEILEIAYHSKNPDRVYQINFNLFPMTHIDGK